MDFDDLLFCHVPESELPYAFWLVSVPWIGRGPIPKLIRDFGSFKEVYEAPDEVLINAAGKRSSLSALLEIRKGPDITEKYNEFLRTGMKISFIWDEDYPMRLKNIPDPPLALFYFGHLPENNRLSVAVIGARQCSDYGLKLAEDLGKALGKNDVNLISGMAMGIDSASQAAAVSAGGSSFAVLGSGADICYPPSSKTLYEKLKTSGGIISQYPPGTKAMASLFPSRNRLVSGMADAVVVLEARTRSGTLITVDQALEQGRDIYAAPGRLGDGLSAGCNGLIGHGARIYLSPEIFLSDLMEDHAQGLMMQDNSSFEKRNAIKPSFDTAADKRHRKYSGCDTVPDDIDKEHIEVYSHLTLFPQSASDIDLSLRKKGLTSPGETGICLILMELCLSDHALQISPGYFCRK